MKKITEMRTNMNTKAVEVRAKLIDKLNAEKATADVIADVSAKNNADLFSFNASAHLSMLNAMYADSKKSDSTITDADVDMCVLDVVNALTDYNDEIALQTFEKYADMSYSEAFMLYLGDQTAKGKRLNKKEDNGSTIYVINEAPIKIMFNDFLEVTNSALYNTLADYCCIFVDNLAKFTTGTDKTGYVTSVALSESYKELRKKKNWELGTPEKAINKTQLATQLTEIIADILPKGMTLKMINADVTFMLHSAIITKDTPNKEGKFVMRRESTVMNFIFRTIWHRYNKKPYDFQSESNSNYGGNVRSAEITPVVPNKKMAEPTPRKEKPCEVSAPEHTLYEGLEVGVAIKHTTFGTGTITATSEKMITATFEDGEHRFNKTSFGIHFELA